MTKRAKPIRKRSTLRELIAHVEGYETVEVTSTARGVEDARKLIIEATREIRAQLEMVAKLQGLFQQDKKNEADAENDRFNSGWHRCNGYAKNGPDWDETAIREAVRPRLMARRYLATFNVTDFESRLRQCGCGRNKKSPPIRVELPPLYPKQREIKRDGRRFNVLDIGRRAVRPSWAYIWPLKPRFEGDPVGWFAPSYKYVLEVWRDLLRPVGAIATR